MTGLLGDINFAGQVDLLVGVITRSEFVKLWTPLELRVERFPALGLRPDTPDRIVWNRCQELGLVLLTGNRNDDGPDSLEATLRDLNTPTSLPVLTAGSAQWIMSERGYAETVAVHLLEYLIDLRERPHTLHGAGRLYLPKPPK